MQFTLSKFIENLLEMFGSFSVVSWIAFFELHGNQVRMIANDLSNNIQWGEGMKNQLCTKHSTQMIMYKG